MKNWRYFLREEVWEEGKLIRMEPSSYRHRTVIVCYSAGRQKAFFANGEKNFGAYIELLREDDSWNNQGNNIVPVLPDGRLIMIVEQRPSQWACANNSQVLELENGKKVDLSAFGPYSSVEFPGGGVDANENFRSSFLRELVEETDIESQSAILYTRCWGIYPFGADLALEVFFGVIYLSGAKFSIHVKANGGLHVLALTPAEVEQNIWKGNILSGQAGFLCWQFYQEVERVRRDPALLEWMGTYLSIKEVSIRVG